MYLSVVALYLRLPAYEHVKSANKCFTNKFKQMPRCMASYSQSLLKGHSLATHSPGSCPLVNASEGQKKFYDAFSLSELTGQTIPVTMSLTFHQNYPVRSIKF